MNRVTFLSVSLCFFLILGLTNREMVQLHTALDQAQQEAGSAKEAALAANKRAELVAQKAEQQLAEARRLRDQAVKVGQLAASQSAASQSAFADAQAEHKSSLAVCAEALKAEEKASLTLSKAAHVRQVAMRERLAAEKTLEAVRLAVAEERKLRSSNETAREQLAADLAAAQSILAEAEVAKAETAEARNLVAEVNRTAAKAQNDRVAAEKALDSAERIYASAVEERKAAQAEQAAALAAIDSAKFEKESAQESLAAAQEAKKLLVEDRANLEKRRAELQLVKEGVERERTAAEQTLLAVEKGRIKARKARAEAIDQQLLLAERMDVMESSKKAARMGEYLAQIARLEAEAERTAAASLRQAAELAKQETLDKQEIIRGMITRLQASQYGTLFEKEAGAETARSAEGQIR